MIGTRLVDGEENQKRNGITTKALRLTLIRVVHQKEKPNKVSYPEEFFVLFLTYYPDKCQMTLGLCLIE